MTILTRLYLTPVKKTNCLPSFSRTKVKAMKNYLPLPRVVKYKEWGSRPLSNRLVTNSLMELFRQKVFKISKQRSSPRQTMRAIQTTTLRKQTTRLPMICELSVKVYSRWNQRSLAWKAPPKLPLPLPALTPRTTNNYPPMAQLLLIPINPLKMLVEMAKDSQGCVKLTSALRRTILALEVSWPVRCNSIGTIIRA